MLCLCFESVLIYCCIRSVDWLLLSSLFKSFWIFFLLKETSHAKRRRLTESFNEKEERKPLGFFEVTYSRKWTRIARLRRRKCCSLLFPEREFHYTPPTILREPSADSVTLQVPRDHPHHTSVKTTRSNEMRHIFAYLWAWHYNYIIWLIHSWLICTFYKFRWFFFVPFRQLLIQFNLRF